MNLSQSLERYTVSISEPLFTKLAIKLFYTANQRTIPAVQFSQPEARETDRHHICCESESDRKKSQNSFKT